MRKVDGITMSSGEQEQKYVCAEYKRICPVWKDGVLRTRCQFSSKKNAQARRDQSLSRNDGCPRGDKPIKLHRNW